MDFINVFTSPIVTAFAGFITISSIFFVLYELMIPKAKKELAKQFLLKMAKNIEIVDIKKYINNTYKSLDKKFDKWFGSPKKFKILDNYFWQNKFIYTSIFICLIPAVIMLIQGDFSYLWGSVTFISIFIFDDLWSSRKKIQITSNLKNFLGVSFYNYCFYAIPALFCLYVLNNLDAATLFETKRTKALLFSLYCLLVVFMLGEIRISIHKLVYGNTLQKFKNFGKYIFVSVIIVAIFAALISIDIWIVQLLHTASKNHENKADELALYIVISLIVVAAPIYIGLYFIFRYAVIMLIVRPIKFLSAKILYFFIISKLYIVTLAVGLTLLIANLLFIFNKK